MSLKLGFATPKSLDRPATLAFALLANNLAGSALSLRKRNTWKDCLSTAINVYGANENGSAAIAAMEKDVAVALVSAAVNDALDDAGYGLVSGVVLDDKGKPTAARNVESAMVKRYGKLSAVSRAQKQARATLAQYSANLRRALDAGVELAEDLTMRDVLSLASDAELNAKPEEEKAAIVAQRDVAKDAREAGKYIESAYAASESNRAIVVLMNAVLLGYRNVEADTHAAFLMELEAYAEQCLKAHQAATPTTEGEQAEGETLADLPEGDAQEATEPMQAVA